MFKILTLLSVTLAATTGFAAPIPPAEVVRAEAIRGRLGFDKEIIQLHADSNDFENGTYFLRVNVRERRLVNYRLPRATFTQYCGYYRATGGTIGDYKPKGVLSRVFIRNDFTGRLEALSVEGTLATDYNETPVVKSYEYHPRGTRLSAPFRSTQMDALIDACNRTGRPNSLITLVFEGYTKCRWKPEIWHKPSLFREEYSPLLGASISQTTLLQCLDF